MAEIKVTTSEVKNRAGELRQLNTQLKAKVEALTNRENRLAGMWEGDAKTAFHNAYMKDKAMFDQFAQLIDQYAQALEQIAQEYDAKEQQNVSIAGTN